MVEKKLRKELDAVVLELEEIKEELGSRLSLLKKKAMPAVVILAGIIGVKIALKILRGTSSFIWGHKLLIFLILLLIPLSYTMIQSKESK
jgi:hypothetical protein